MIMETPINIIPDWLVMNDLPAAIKPSAKVVQELAEQTYEIIFETFLEKVAEGRVLVEILEESPHDIDPGKFRTWIHKDAKRKERYYAARAIGAEAVEDEILKISDGINSMNDIQRAELMTKNRFRLLAIWDRDRYGERRDVKVTTDSTINIRTLLEKRESQLKTLGNIYDGERIDPGECADIGEDA